MDFAGAERMRKMDVVVLGCGGYIGSHLLDHLLADGAVRVTGWDLETHKIRRHLGHPRLRFHREDLASAGALRRLRTAIGGADVVVNLAAICNPAEYNTRPLTVLRANLFDLHPVIDLCAELNTWLIHFSTSEVYGRTLSSYLGGGPEPLAEELYLLDEHATPLIMGPVHNQRWSYAAAKQVAERLIYAHHHESGLPFTVVRPLNFFGPRMDYLPGRDGHGIPRVLACFMAALLDGTPMKLVDGGTARRTIVSIDDAMDAILRMLHLPDRAQNQIFNIGNPDNEVTIRELAERMRDIYASITGDPGYRDHPIVSVTAEEFYGPGYEDCDRRMPRIDNARRLLGWNPTRTLAATLEETMRYYHAAYAA